MRSWTAGVAEIVTVQLVHSVEARRHKRAGAVLLSSAKKREVRERKTYSIFIALDEFVTPVRAIISARYELVFADCAVVIALAIPGLLGPR